MTATRDTARDNLERDITEALLRVKLARARREREEVVICEKRLDWLLDRYTGCPVRMHRRHRDDPDAHGRPPRR